MKVIVHNTGFEADGIPAGAKVPLDIDAAEALVNKWGGMMKLLPYDAPAEAVEAPAPRKVGRPKKSLSKKK